MPAINKRDYIASQQRYKTVYHIAEFITYAICYLVDFSERQSQIECKVFARCNGSKMLVGIDLGFCGAVRNVAVTPKTK